MILFDLRCATGHVFEAWFKDGTAFERQSKRGQIACPACGSHKVAKSPMAPNLASGEKGDGETSPAAERQTKLAAAMRAARETVEKTFEDVGERFPEEARRIHYGEAQKRKIYGEATLDEARELREEGVEFGILPWPRRSDS